MPSSSTGSTCATIVNMRNRPSPRIDEKAVTAPSSTKDEIRYVLPPRFAIVGDALAPLVNNLRTAMAQDAGFFSDEFVIPESLSHHLGVIQRVLERLPTRVAGLISDSVSSGESDVAHIYRAAGRLEEVLSDWVDGFQDVKASHAQPEIGEVRDLLVDVYRHHLLEVCNWLADLVKVIADPAVAIEKSGLPMGDGATLTVALTITVPPEMADLLAIAKRMQVDSLDEIASTPISIPTHVSQNATPVGPGILGTLGALAFGIGFTKAVLGRNRD